jgi:hypothetical protein
LPDLHVPVSLNRELVARAGLLAPVSRDLIGRISSHLEM